MDIQQYNTIGNQPSDNQEHSANETQNVCMKVMQEVCADDTQETCANESTTASLCTSANPLLLHQRLANVIGWVLVILWSGFIFFMSANTGSDLNEGTGIVSTIFRTLHEAQTALIGPNIDVVSSIGHFCEYAVFGALWVSALRNHMPLRNAIVLAIVFASIYGITDEFHQLFVPNRMCDPVDWVVDTVGATLGAVTTMAVLGRRKTLIHH